jgi:RimJ/RimL family protein N-acetyltransferase
MSIQGNRLFLRAVERTDLAYLHKWQNDPDITRQLSDKHFPSSMYQQEQWYERIQDDRLTMRLAIVLNDGPVIGYSGFWDIHWQDRRAEHAILIGQPEYRSQGYGRETIMTCSRYAFEEIGLLRLEALILETNSSSLKAYQACGYQIEGVLRQRSLRQGIWANTVVLGLLAADFRHAAEVAGSAGRSNQSR